MIERSRDVVSTLSRQRGDLLVYYKQRSAEDHPLSRGVVPDVLLREGKKLIWESYPEEDL
jgi:hypothetical protein